CVERDSIAGRGRRRFGRARTLGGVERGLGLCLRGLVGRVGVVLARLLRIARERLAFLLGDLALAIGLRYRDVVLRRSLILRALGCGVPHFPSVLFCVLV